MQFSSASQCAEDSPLAPKAARQYLRHLQSRAWDAWCEAVAQTAPERAAWKRATRKASRMLTLRVLRAWSGAIAAAKVCKPNTAHETSREQLLSPAMHVQALVVSKRWADAYRAGSLVRRAWRSWQHERAVTRAARVLSLKTARSLQHALLQQWRTRAAELRASERRQRQCRRIWARACCRRAFSRWHAQLLAQRDEMERSLAATRFCRSHLLAAAWRAWWRLRAQQAAAAQERRLQGVDVRPCSAVLCGCRRRSDAA